MADLSREGLALAATRAYFDDPEIDEVDPDMLAVVDALLAAIADDAAEKAAVWTRGYVGAYQHANGPSYADWLRSLRQEGR